MILTCPACDTKYVVKDGAIPPGGRQVRCAACKHSWHQDSEGGDGVMASAGEDQGPPPVEQAFGGPPPPDPDQSPEPIEDVPEQAEAEQMVSDYAEPVADYDEPIEDSAPYAAEEEPANYGLTAPAMSFAPVVPAAEPAAEPEPAAEWREPEDDFGIAAFEDEDDRPRGGGLKVALILLLLIALAAAAFWFLAPPNLKAKVGLASAGGTPLKVMLTTSDRQKLSSGNDLLAISGRVINPTDEEQAIPPIRASLRVKATRKLVYQWTIAPPARSLPPGGSASFNSAEVGIPDIGDELSLSLGAARS